MQNKIEHCNKYLSGIGNTFGVITASDSNKTKYIFIDYSCDLTYYTTTNARSMELFVYGFVSGFNYHNEI